MEENRDSEINSENLKGCDCKSKNRSETIGMLLAAFLGGFLAIYFVADQVFDKSYAVKQIPIDKFEHKMVKDFNKMYERQRKAIEKDFAAFDKNFPKLDIDYGFQGQNLLADSINYGVKINTEIDDDEYKIIVNLNPFDGDENKVNYNVSGRKVTIFGDRHIKDKNFEQNMSFSHDFLLPQNADISKIKKEKDGNNLIIEIPLKK